MLEVEQQDYRALDVSLNSAGEAIHISQEDETSSGEFDLGVIVELAAVPKLIAALQELSLDAVRSKK